MLVLSRKVSERILIGDEVVITIVRLNAHAVRVGITAPDSVAIVREELLPNPAQSQPVTPSVPWQEAAA